VRLFNHRTDIRFGDRDGWLYVPDVYSCLGVDLPPGCVLRVSAHDRLDARNWLRASSELNLALNTTTTEGDQGRVAP
jgi:hypothetical protein